MEEAPLVYTFFKPTILLEEICETVFAWYNYLTRPFGIDVSRCSAVMHYVFVPIDICIKREQSFG